MSRVLRVNDWVKSVTIPAFRVKPGDKLEDGEYPGGITVSKVIVCYDDSVLMYFEETGDFAPQAWYPDDWASVVAFARPAPQERP